MSGALLSVVDWSPLKLLKEGGGAERVVWLEGVARGRRCEFGLDGRLRSVSVPLYESDAVEINECGTVRPAEIEFDQVFDPDLSAAYEAALLAFARRRREVVPVDAMSVA